MDKKALRQQRFALFVNQFGDDQGQRHGWKSDLARRIGKSPSAVSQYASGGLKAETDTIQLVIDKFGIAPEFFTDPTIGKTPHYRDFAGKRFASASIKAAASAGAGYALNRHRLSAPDKRKRGECG